MQICANLDVNFIWNSKNDEKSVSIVQKMNTLKTFP